MQTLSFAPMNCIDANHVSENTGTAKKQLSVFTHVTSIYANLLEQKKAFP